MKKKLLPIIVVTGGLVLSGCAPHPREVVTTGPVTTTQTTRTVAVTQAPPPPRTEGPTVEPAPAEAHVWVSGFWNFTNNRWVWMPGHWELRPRAGAMWVPGHWDQSPDGRGWVWTPGYWQ